MSKISAPLETQNRPVGRSNKRATIRYGCAPATIGKIYVSQDHEYQHGCVDNLSLTGVGMTLGRPITVGTSITIHIRSNDKSRSFELTALVAHCTETLHQEWWVGCEFVKPLLSEELDLLL